MAAWTRHPPCTRSGSTGTSAPRCCPRSRPWSRAITARTPSLPARWTGRHCTACWPRSRRSAWTCSRSASSPRTANHQDQVRAAHRDGRTEVPRRGDSTYAGLVAPATLQLIDRGDLLAALDRAAARQVTIISAPAGSGKTSLLRAWAARPGQRHRVAVLQVQRDQHDAQQFWLALLGAVRQAVGTVGGTGPPAATPEVNGRAMGDRVLSELDDHA